LGGLGDRLHARARAELAAGVLDMQMDSQRLPAAFSRLVAEGAIKVEGDAAGVERLLGMLEQPEAMFNVVEP
jgi:alkyl sulfatase BDS1-like metallo-beta-lactamase superfamily hydrolase